VLGNKTVSYFACSNFTGLSAWQKKKTIYFEVSIKPLSSNKLIDLRIWLARTFSSAKMNVSARNLDGRVTFDGSS
jgi:hypothetical protein